MRELVQQIPDPQFFLALETEALAGNILFLLQGRKGKFHGGNLEGEMWATRHDQGGYPHEMNAEIGLAFREAWSWLEAQGLIVPDEGSNGQSGWRWLSRRARKMESHEAFANFRTARLLQREQLHPSISERVWLAFMRGDFDSAVLHAMKAVEVSVREAARFGNDMFGVKLMREAFAPNGGPLTDEMSEPSERVGRMELFAGAVASYKNPASHRDVNLEDPAEVSEIIFLANHLLRIVDARKAVIAAGATAPTR